MKILVLVLVVLGSLYFIDVNNSSLKKDRSLENIYPVLVSEQFFNKPILPEAPGQKTVQPVVQEKPEVYYCGDTKAEYKLYASKKQSILSKLKGEMGGWRTISVIDCSSEYYILDFSGGPMYYGPFEK